MSIPSWDTVNSVVPSPDTSTWTTFPECPGSDSRRDHAPLLALMSHSSTAPPSPTVTASLPPGTTSASLTGSACASSTWARRPFVSYRATAPSDQVWSTPAGVTTNHWLVASRRASSSGVRRPVATSR